MTKRKTAARRPVGPLWSIPVPVAEIPETGRKLEVAADAATRAALAKALGVIALPRLEVTAELFRHGRGGARASGQVSATVEQACVVTLDPLQNEIVEAFDLTFGPPVAETAAADLTLDADEPAETLRDGSVDLGAIASEFLVLGIDPYPRKPGVAFDVPPAGDPSSHPFASLAALKKQP
jgi:uncharacterized metal-binding protein YceD (DUF177 family)